MLGQLLSTKEPAFWQGLLERTQQSTEFQDLISLATLRRRALAQGFSAPGGRRKIRIALVGGFTLYPLSELLVHYLYLNSYEVELWIGQYDNFAFELLEPSSEMYEFRPDVIVFLPPDRRYKYSGSLLDSKETVLGEIASKGKELLELCKRANAHSNCQIVLCNFMLPNSYDPGSWRGRTLASEWNFLKSLNTEIGLKAPEFVSVCDVEFLAARHGGLEARDNRAWFESKQPYSLDFCCLVAREIAHAIQCLQTPSKKVLVMDLDDTLWGGEIGEDGISGIELGETSTKGECFKEFQRTICLLRDRGVLLSVCSKNDLDVAMQPFKDHPEMLLRLEDIASFKANWNPKVDNLIEIANDLNLSLDSLVFMDDNPAEIELVRQFVPDVTTLWLGSDPSQYVQRLLDCRLFEPRQLTKEDTLRTRQYRDEQQRNALPLSSSDMETYLNSLEMNANVCEFGPADVPRITQLINKSNQFNPTTHRRTEGRVKKLVDSKEICFSLRLNDKFGELGLVSAIIAVALNESDLFIDTWVMSCRVLKRQVEHTMMNELMKLAKQHGFTRVIGQFISSGKNRIVKDLYSTMGFSLIQSTESEATFEAFPATYQEFRTHIRVTTRGTRQEH